MAKIRMAALAVAAAASLAAGSSLAAGKANWLATVAILADGSHVLGNPKAQVKLTEYVSYTCGHCADFQQKADTPLRIAYVMPGKVSINVRHFLRDPIDLTVAMLTNCGDHDGFFKRHHAFLYSQDKWLSKLDGMPSAKRSRWSNGPMETRLQAVANDFGFYAMIESHGISRAQANRCLADDAMAERLIGQTEAAREFGVYGTPSFSLDGTLLAGTHDWSSLQPQILARLD